MALHVAFLWHMHQPDYVDQPEGGRVLMPWVRLHATKGYLDMIWLAEQYPGFHCTFNLTPVLVKQIQQLANGEVRDEWHELAAAAPETLTPGEKASLLEHFFKANWGNMVKPHPRYWSLLQKRGLNRAKVDLDQVARNFTDAELRDVQVWFNLAWFGYAAERLHPEVAELKRKGGGFTEEDKRMVFGRQEEILKGVLGRYKALAERGQVELSTSPFYHPILPLVYHTEFARRCMPGRALPPPYSHPEDVRAQLELARAYHREVFGAAPHGVWPSEGSVCPELIPILEELGYEWMATDEESLWRSLAVVYPGMNLDRNMLFQGWRAKYGDARVCLAFRERGLSDFVGFTASRNEPHRAAEFMVGQIEQIARGPAGSDGLCAVILDGENAWENFADGGETFLRELYGRLTAHAAVTTTTLHEYFSQHPPRATLTTLHTGSWIRGDFDIWIGEPEENRGWELLGRTRDFLQARADRGEIGPEQYEQALQEIYAAEGSDWFWWYGGDFVTENDVIFDELFRTHLQNVYRLCGAPVPEVLKTNICRSEVAVEVRQPTDLMTPVIDGLMTSYYEWASAGVYEAGRSMGAMYRSERCVESVHFGSDLTTFYLRVDFRMGVGLPEQAGLRVNFVEPTQRALIIPRLKRGVAAGELWGTGPGGENRKLMDVGQIRFEKILELGIPLADLGWKQRQQASFFVQLLESGVELERHPGIGTLNMMVPDELLSTENWWV
jgi:alpha-amylase/alpha-mannosidase (GH57 family)